MDEDKKPENSEPRRETIELYVTGNGSDSATVQEVLNELASFPDEVIAEAQARVESWLEIMEDSWRVDHPDVKEDDEVEYDDLYFAIEKLAELLSELHLYNKVQRLDPVESALLSRHLRI